MEKVEISADERIQKCIEELESIRAKRLIKNIKTISILEKIARLKLAHAYALGGYLVQAKNHLSSCNDNEDLEVLAEKSIAKSCLLYVSDSNGENIAEIKNELDIVERILGTDNLRCYEFWFFLGRLFMKIKDYNASFHYLSYSKRIFPNDSRVLLWYARVCLSLNRFDEGCGSCRECMQLTSYGSKRYVSAMLELSAAVRSRLSMKKDLRHEIVCLLQEFVDFLQGSQAHDLSVDREKRILLIRVIREIILLGPDSTKEWLLRLVKLEEHEFGRDSDIVRKTFRTITEIDKLSGS